MVGNIQLNNQVVQKYSLSITGIALLLLFCVAYRDSLAPLLVLWLGLDEVSDMSGLLALACSIYLLYDKRHRFRNLEVRPNYLAGLVLAGLSLLWLVAYSVSVQTVQFALLPLILMAGVGLWLGNRHLGLVFVPIFILYFVLPVWSPLLPVLRNMTTDVAHWVLLMIGRPVFVQGYVLHLPGGSFLVDESCAGLRFFLVTLLLSFVCHELYRLTYRQTAILITCGVLLALVANWLRVVIIILVGDYTLMESPLVEDHANLGWLIYGIIVLIPFILINNYLTKRQPAIPVAGPDSEYSERKPDLYNSGLVAFLLVIGPLLSFTLRLLPAENIEIHMPQQMEAWSSVSLSPRLERQRWSPEYFGYTEIVSARYEKDKEDGRAIDSYIVYYADQSQGAELINVNNQLADGVRWRVRENTQEVTRLDLGNSEFLEVNVVEVAGVDGQTYEVWYWYNVGGLNTAGNANAKLLQFLAMVGGRRDASLIAFGSPCGFDCSDSSQELSEFVRENYDKIGLL